MKITPVITVYLGLENRDGRLVAVKADNQKHYLVLEADTYHKPEVFKDMGSTVHVEITEDAFNALRGDWRAIKDAAAVVRAFLEGDKDAREKGFNWIAENMP